MRTHLIEFPGGHSRHGWDLATIAAGGFTAVRLDRLRALVRLASLPDADMMNELRCARVDAAAPDPANSMITTRAGPGLTT